MAWGCPFIGCICQPYSYFGKNWNTGSGIQPGNSHPWLLVFLQGKQKHLGRIAPKSWCFLVISGFATGASWLCYYRVLQEGPASVVVPIDKLSILVTILFSRIFLGERLDRKSFAGLVLLCAAITSIIGAAYTSVSFLKTFSKSIEENENKVIIGFIIISTAIMFILGNPAVLLVLAGAVNGLILPITLAICLIAAHKKSIMGENYHHPVVLTILGVIVVILTAYLGVTTFVSKIGTLL